MAGLSKEEHEQKRGKGREQARALDLTATSTKLDAVEQRCQAKQSKAKRAHRRRGEVWQNNSNYCPVRGIVGSRAIDGSDGGSKPKPSRSTSNDQRRLAIYSSLFILLTSSFLGFSLWMALCTRSGLSRTLSRSDGPPYQEWVPTSLTVYVPATLYVACMPETSQTSATRIIHYRHPR